jgi:transcriptional regulator with XRE-family HTH domain
VTTGELTRRARKKRGLSLRAAAAKVGLSTSALHRIETGAREARADELTLLADLYATKVGSFFAAKSKARAS